MSRGRRSQGTMIAGTDARALAGRRMRESTDALELSDDELRERADRLAGDAAELALARAGIASVPPSSRMAIMADLESALAQARGLWVRPYAAGVPLLDHRDRLVTVGITPELLPALRRRFADLGLIADGAAGLRLIARYDDEVTHSRVRPADCPAPPATVPASLAAALEVRLVHRGDRVRIRFESGICEIPRVDENVARARARKQLPRDLIAMGVHEATFDRDWSVSVAPTDRGVEDVREIVGPLESVFGVDSCTHPEGTWEPTQTARGVPSAMRLHCPRCVRGRVGVVPLHLIAREPGTIQLPPAEDYLAIEAREAIARGAPVPDRLESLVGLHGGTVWLQSRDFAIARIPPTVLPARPRVSSGRAALSRRARR